MRVLLLSDIQGNLPAFETVLQDAAGKYDKIWYLGDIVGNGPYPNECVELLESLNPISVVGNEDWLAIDRFDLDDFTEEARSLRLWVREQLSDKSRDYLNSLPEKLVQEDDFTLVHGSPRHPVWEYVLYPNIAQASFECLDTTYCFTSTAKLTYKNFMVS
jgi:predicted phosphodiesterase